MIDISYTWLGIGIGTLLVLAALVWGKWVSKSNLVFEEVVDPKKNITEPAQEISIQVQIRQIALIEKDEFKSFYQPVIDRVQEYEKILSGEKIGSRYFETVYKALRKRRSAIFEFGSSENDKKKGAIWSFALFTTLSLRFIVQRLAEFNFTLDDRQLNPVLVDSRVLARCNVTQRAESKQYAAGLSNIHLIDKVLSTSVIERFNQAGIYSFIVNSVTGIYQERVNPFHSIIEQVESYMGGEEIDEASVFQQNLKRVLSLVERNTFSVNQVDSFIFEGASYLLIDRNFLWELFRMYAVSVSQPMGKKEFEVQLKSVLNLTNQFD